MFKEISAIVIGWIAFIVVCMFGSFFAYQYFAQGDLSKANRYSS